MGTLESGGPGDGATITNSGDHPEGTTGGFGRIITFPSALNQPREEQPVVSETPSPVLSENPDFLEG